MENLTENQVKNYENFVKNLVEKICVKYRQKITP
jgi:hypothetical protein